MAPCGQMSGEARVKAKTVIVPTSDDVVEKAGQVGMSLERSCCHHYYSCPWLESSGRGKPACRLTEVTEE